MITRILGTAALLTLGVVPLNSMTAATASPSCYQPTWSAPGESLSEWGSRQVPAGTNDRLTIVPAPLGNSPHALRAEVRDGDVAVNQYNGQPIAGGWRAEGVAPTIESSSSGTVRYTWSTMLDTNYPVNPVGTDGRPIWQVITQWHQGDNDLGSVPPIAYIIEGDQIKLDLSTPGALETKYVVAPLARGTWHRFQMDINWALNGSVTVWHNGDLVVPETPAQTLFPQQGSTAPGTAFMKMGLYRKATPAGGPFVLYHDEVSRSVPATGQTGPETVLRPDGDVLRQWTGGTPGAAAAAIDDPVTQPVAVAAADYIYSSGAGRVTEVTLQDQAMGTGTASVTGWFYANAGTGTVVRADLVRGSTVLATTTVPAASGFAWRSISAQMNLAGVNDLRLRFTTTGGGDSNIRAAYATTVATIC